MNEQSITSSHSNPDSNTRPLLWTLFQAVIAILLWLLLEAVFNMFAQGAYKVAGETHHFNQADFIGFYVPLMTVVSQLLTFIYWQAWMSYFSLMNRCSFRKVRNALGLVELDSRQMLKLVLITAGGLLLTALFISWLQQQFMPAGQHTVHSPDALKQMALFLTAPFWARLPLILMVVVTAPFFEELAFRGMLQPAMVRHFGVKMGILVTTTLFVGAHAHYYQSPFLMADIFCISLILGWLREHSNSLWPCIFAHAFHNAIALFSLGM